MRGVTYLSTLSESLRHRESRLLILLVLVAGGLWIFVEIAQAMLGGDTTSIDRRIFLAMRDPQDLSPIGPRWMMQVARDVTALGGYTVLTLVTIAVAGFLFLSRHGKAARLLLVSMGVGALLQIILKAGFDRPRPSLVPHEAIVYSSSFPSGHAMMAAIAYLTFGALLAQSVTSDKLKVYVVTVTLVLTIAIGVSRVYLGVHWPSDVLAGWTIGAAWAFSCLALDLWLEAPKRT